ncbi:hypothetical protein F5Y01DRAFT_313627 [Xylaria sp. FL0043]|nr:hypothetical protein F5Y01DRAFT_313627 [Xylaria sp. FL0043]
MKRLKLFILNVRELVNEDANSALARLRPTLTEQVRVDIKNLEQSAVPIRDLFRKYNNDRGPFGMTFRFRTATDIYFALGYSKETLNEMHDAAARARQNLMQTLSLMGIFGTNALLANTGNSNPPPRAGPKPQIKSTKKGGRWPVTFAHSAGLFVEDRSDCISILKALNRQWAQYFTPWSGPLLEVAMAALFEDKYLNYPNGAQVKDAMMAQRSRGITKNIFKVDYNLAFAWQEYNCLLQLRKTLLGLYGTSTVPEGKGQIVHLGQYLAQGKKVEVLGGMGDNSGNLSCENWNTPAGQVKTAVKEFLKKELNWK